MLIGVGCGDGPGPGVVGAEESGVEEGEEEGFSTTHILGSSQYRSLLRRDGLPMGFCRDELGDCMSEGGVWIDVEDRV